MDLIILTLPTNRTRRIAWFLIMPIIGALFTLISSGLIETMLSNHMDRSSNIKLTTVFGAILFAPLFETLLGQSLPFHWSKARRKSLLFTFFIMSVPFAVLHAHNGIAAFLGAFVGGLVFTTIYLIWYPASRAAAFTATALTHFFHNSGTLVLMLYSGVTLIPISQ